jgi:hypothetical protein
MTTEELLSLWAKLSEAQSEYNEAYSEYNEAYDTYEGHSWGWAGQGFIDTLETARRDFMAAMDKYIDERVETKLSEILRNGVKQ